MKLLEKLRFKKMNSSGVSHLLIPAVVVVGIASTGTYALVASHAGTTDRLTAGHTLTAGSSIVSSDNGMKLAMQTDGNLVVYNHSSKAVWQSKTSGSGANRLQFQTDGNLVLYTAANRAVWNAGTVGKGANVLIMQTDGNLVAYKSGPAAVWQTNTRGQLGDRLRGGQALVVGTQLTSADGGMHLQMQTDGNLVLRNHNNIAIWASRTSGANNRAIFQGDGNFVIYNGSNAVWSSQSNGKGGNELILQNDANLVAYKPGAAIWQTNTSGKQNYTPPVPVTQPDPGSGTGTGDLSNDGCGGNATHYNGSTHVGQGYNGGSCRCNNGTSVAYGPAYQGSTPNPKCAGGSGTSGGGSTPPSTANCHSGGGYWYGSQPPCGTLVRSYTCYVGHDNTTNFNAYGTYTCLFYTTGITYSTLNTSQYHIACVSRGKYYYPYGSINTSGRGYPICETDD